jgi:hypothetical protein
VQKRVECLLGGVAVGPGDEADGDLGIAGTGGLGLRVGVGVGRGGIEHRRHRHVAVARDPLPVLRGDVAPAQQLSAIREGFGVLADPGRAHRLLIDCAPRVNIPVDEQRVVGLWDLGGAFGEQVAQPVTLVAAVTVGDGIQGLCAGGPKFPRL